MLITLFWRMGLATWFVSNAILITTIAAQTPRSVERWLGPQQWERDTDGPILSLGKPGEFDDTHIFAPTVARENGRFLLWYCGSQGTARDLAGSSRVVDERVFKLGLATSSDGKTFQRHAGNPVMALGDNLHSILTPCVLRAADGNVTRENGKLRMWFSSAAFRGDRVHTVHETTSADGIEWSEPSAALITNAYCPSVLKSGNGYRMWYTDVTQFPWVLRHARSDDGHTWIVSEQPVLKLTQSWEARVLVYPTVLEVDGMYLMWYGSYTRDDRQHTAIGFAASEDGITWHKHPQNPVLTSDPNRPWESHYVTSESVVRMPDGSFRMWYASRKAPPFTNLYFAINTARWAGPEEPNALTLGRGMYTLVELNGQPINTRDITLEFDLPAGRASGSTGVNRWGGSFKVSGQSIEFGQLFMTRRAGPPEAMRLEREFTQAIDKVTQLATEGDRLSMSTGDAVALVFVRASGDPAER